MLTGIFISLWLLLFIIYFFIRRKMRVLYPDKHRLLFSKGLADHSVEKSITWMQFAWRPSNWSFVEDRNLLFLLRLNFVFCAVFYGFIIVVVAKALFKAAFV